MSRARAFPVVILVWALIYLPRLGSLEIKSEEGRRVLPAVTMLESGNYLVPQVGSEPYFRKPPLVNWLVAGSFEIFGTRNEWTARLPSVLCVLAVALAFVGAARRSLGPNGSLAASLMWLTNFGLLEKGRMIEIEALYISLTALAFICWLSWWREPRLRWIAWTVPWIFLGLGLLAKGPLHLLFFYAVVVAVLWQARELRRLWSWPHLLGLVLMLSIFAAWAIPSLETVQAGHVANVWSRQFSGRMSGEDFKFANWLLNIPRGLAYLLPWAALLPFARFRLLEETETRRFCRALSLGIALPFLIVSLMPGALPRYNMPLLAPAIWLLAIFIREHALIWPKALRKTFTWTVAAVTVAMLIYSLALIPFLKRREKIRPIAAELDTAIPPNETLYAVDPDYQPYLFYLQRHIIYADRIEDLPRSARYLLVQPDNEKPAERSAKWAPQQAQPILRIKDYRSHRVVLLRVAAPSLGH
ncbi:MAG TPA: glycosyltransferase family 39 protein [Chthoniobacterales bacterium]